MVDNAPDLNRPSNCLCFAVRKASRAVSQAYDTALAPVGITGQQFSLLAALGAMEGASLTELAAQLRLDRTTLTRNLRPLERDGLIESGTDADGRVRRLALTPLGKERLAEAKRIWIERQSKLVEAFGAEDARALVAALSRLADAAQP